MTTEETNLIPIQRDISVLLELDTYQGMTDEEIDSLIEYHVDYALRSEESAARMAAIESSMNAQLETYRQLERDSQSVLECVRGQSIPWVTIAADGTMIQNV